MVTSKKVGKSGEMLLASPENFNDFVTFSELVCIKMKNTHGNLTLKMCHTPKKCNIFRDLELHS